MENIRKKGHIFVISGPSGVGKGTLLSALLKRHPEIELSVSVTTRQPRAGEIEGKSYHFTDKENFKDLIEKGELLEWAEFAGNYYGTYIKTVLEAIDSGTDIALEIDVNGALQIKNKIKDAILIFILPPSIEELKSRLIKRNTESEADMTRRLAVVSSEISKKEEFHYNIVNEDLELALSELEMIILTERNKDSVIR